MNVRRGPRTCTEWASGRHGTALRCRAEVAHILLHGEDPGTMNFLLALPFELAAHGVEVDVLLEPAALRSRASAYRAGGLSARRIAEMLFARRARISSSSERRKTADHAAFELVRRARAAGVESAAIVDLPVNAQHRFRGTGNDPLAHAPHWFVVPDDDTLEAVVGLGVSAQRMFRVRNPRFDEIARRRASIRAEDVAAARRQLTGWHRGGRSWCSRPSRPASPIPGCRNAVPTIDSWAAATRPGAPPSSSKSCSTRSAGSSQRPYLVVRLHPKNRVDEFAAYRGEVDAFSVGGDPLDALLAADVVVGMTSMILQEAALFGNRVLSIVPRPAEREWLPMLGHGAIGAVSERAAIAPACTHCWRAPHRRRRRQREIPALADFVLERLRSLRSR